MVVSPQLLAKMSVTPTYSGGVTSWSILMNFRYPFSWQTVSDFVLRQKAKGPPDDMVTLEVERNIYKYTVKMPWYARLVLGKSIVWHDVIDVDRSAQVLNEDGQNINLQRLGSVRDMSTWRACDEDPNITLYNKKLDFNIRMPVGPTVMMQVAQPLIRWFQKKSQLCREMEVKAIREFIEAEGNRIEDETATSGSSFLLDEEEEHMSENAGTESPRGARIATAKAKAAVAAGVAVANSRRTTKCKSDE